MSTTDPPERESTPADTPHVSTIDEAAYCVLFARPDTDALVAASLVAAARHAYGKHFQVSVVRTPQELADRLHATDDTATSIAIGPESTDIPSVSRRPLSRWGYEVASKMGAEPDPLLTLAGLAATDMDPGEDAQDILEDTDLEPAPGVAVPTSDIVDGLTHMTLVHAAFSGNLDQTSEALADLGEDPSSTTVASFLGLSIAGSDSVPDRAATAIERAIRPYRTSHRFQTLGGYADVLSALAREAPGLAIALAFDRGDADRALSIWRERAVEVHAAVRDADCVQKKDITVARVDGPLEPTASLLRDFKASKSTVVAVSGENVAIAGTAPTVGDSFEMAVSEVGGSGFGRGLEGYANVPPSEFDEFLDVLRAEL